MRNKRGKFVRILYIQQYFPHLNHAYIKDIIVFSVKIYIKQENNVKYRSIIKN